MTEMRFDFDKINNRRGTDCLKWDITEKDELPMWVADMDFETAPCIKEAILSRAAHGVFGYSIIPDEWKHAYINWWKSRHGIEYKPEQLIFTTGVIPIISSCVRRLTQPAENVLIMTPVYNIFYNSILNNGRNVKEVPLAYSDGEYSVNWDALEEGLSDPQTSLMILCNPQNPVGKIWDRETLARIGELAYDNGVTVISDEIHCDLTDPGLEYVPFASVSEKCRKNCVVCLAPTKAFNIAGIQTAAAVIPDTRIRHRVWRALNNDEVAEPNAFAIGAAVAAFTGGGEWLDELRAYIAENKRYVRGFMAEKLPEIKVINEGATYLMWLDLSAYGFDNAAEEIRRRSGLFMSEGYIYGGDSRDFARLNVACPKALVEEGMQRLYSALKGDKAE